MNTRTNTPAQRKHVVMSPGHYRAVADVINKIADGEQRQDVADHFATEFRIRFPHGFDPGAWSQLCGGKVRGFDIRKGKFVDR